METYTIAEAKLEARAIEELLVPDPEIDEALVLIEEFTHVREEAVEQQEDQQSDGPS